MNNENLTVNEAYANTKESLKNVKSNLKLLGTAIVNYNKSKIGTVKTTVVEKVKSGANNIDLKIKLAFDKAGVFALETANKSMETLNAVKDKVTNYRTEQIEKFKEWKVRRVQKKKERKEQRRANYLNFKNGIVQKVDSAKSKIGTVKTTVVEKVKSGANNIDLKIKLAFDKAGVFALETANKGMETLNTAKDKVTNYRTEQIEKFKEWKARRAQKRAERKDKISLERQKYLEEHEKKIEQMRQLVDKLKDEKNQLIGKETIKEEPLNTRFSM